jgi:hypothetical protein
MTDAALHVDPDRLRLLAEELSMFSNDIKVELQVLDLGVSKLGATWKDEGYEEFRNAIQPIRRVLDTFHQEIVRTKPRLLEDAEAIRQYQRLHPS